ncbi:hypothetical protein AVEN_241512-1 [Araneus ventricosus]|uniref:Reverse transcriptase/retrotransposon-derived protein RNase H-like domain-containing protein n=1 Tax=Araneus ventricosus TaxID=182803 RepID=A0A4Y2R9J6_ARAVE|nr:hypothetical protein AVEN_241512-1 [Araneus ventricosus]
MIKFYHRFLKNAASTHAYLHDVVKGRIKKDKTSIIWTDETKEAFRACKELFKDAAMLAYPKHNTPLSLVSDASETAIGAVLQQHVEGGRDFLVFTDHKPFTYTLKQNHEKNSPRQIRHLEFIGLFATDLRYISGSTNLVADTFSRIAAISVPESIDFDEMAVAQDSDVELRSPLGSGSGLEFKQLNLLSSQRLLYCDISTGQTVRSRDIST